jgi:hypothetical protein
VWRHALVVISALLLGAHFLRDGQHLLVLLSLLFPALLLVRRGWATPVLRGLLVLACAEWLRTAWVLAQQRQAVGEPWMRMALILGGVAAITALSARVARART